ncbi:MAG: hypothetical protein JTT11_09105 [Candidatus Brockarchaeota archaeon]|nr:hypothetical protein [Candidatus Brockarchaeota archaeon]
MPSMDRLIKSATRTVWSLFLFVSMVSVINLLRITYYPVAHRVSYEKIIRVVLLSESLDSHAAVILSAASSFLLILSVWKNGRGKRLFLAILSVINLSALLSFYEFDYALAALAIGISSCILLHSRENRDAMALAKGVAIILCAIEAISLLRWLLHPLQLPSRIADPLSRFSAIEAELFYAPADLTPIAMLVLLFSYPLFHLARKLKGVAKSSSVVDANPGLSLDGRIMLAVAVAITALVASYPYLPSVNPAGKYVGTDIYYYEIWLDEMEKGPSSAFDFAIRHVSSRPLFLLALHYLKPGNLQTVTFLEWIGVPVFCLLTVSAYFFGSVFKGRNFAGLAALLSSFSINVVAGMYTAYYSNAIALALLYAALAALLLALRRRSCLFALFSAAPSVIAIFVHPWTWAFLQAAVCAFAGLQLLSVARSRKFSEALRNMMPVIVFVAANVIADLLKTLLLAAPSAAGISYELAGGAVSMNEFYNLWFNLYFTFRFFAGGYFNNFFAITSAILGAWWLSKQDGNAEKMLLAWLSVGSVPTLFVNFWVNERIFYNLPIQMLSAAGLCFWLPRYRSSGMLRKALLILFVLVNLNYALRSMANLV